MASRTSANLGDIHVERLTAVYLWRFGSKNKTGRVPGWMNGLLQRLRLVHKDAKLRDLDSNQD